MNKKIYVLMLGACVAFGANAQYQLTNSGFEDWEDVTYNKKTGQEPTNWNSFLDGTGEPLYQAFAGVSQVEKSSDAHDGNASAMIWCRKVMGSILAQGNLTTGCINMGSMTPSDSTGNYNYTNRAREDQSMKFTGLPDELHVWLKVQIGDESKYTAKVNAVLHTDGYYQDPEANDITAKVVAKAEKKDVVGTNGEWKEFVIPFAYTEGVNERPAYALVSFATCSTPGKGTAYDSDKKTGDVMYIDDISMVYFSELATLTYDGVSLLEKGKTDYELLDQSYVDSKLATTVKGKGATIETSYDAESALLTITVKGANISEDATNYHEYTIQFGK